MDSMEKLFSSYSATLSKKDQNIFREIFQLDQKSILLKYHPFIWGPNASAYYSSIADTRYTLFKLPRIDQVLAQYKKTPMIKTLENFPLDLSFDQNNHCPDLSEIYDPRFILVSLYHLLSPDNAVNCNKVISLRGLSIALMATSSNQPSMRSLGYAVLSRLYQHLEGSKSTNAVYFWVHFIDCYRASLFQPNQQVSFLLNLFLVTAIEIVSNPKDSQFYKIKDFLTSKAKFDGKNLAKLFVDLLNTSELEWKHAQKTVLTLLSLSIKTYQDFEITTNHNLYRHVMSLYTTNWADNYSKVLILKYVKNCIKLPEALKMLLIEDALIVWLTHLIVSQEGKMSPSELCEIDEIVAILEKSCEQMDLPDNCLVQPLDRLKSWLLPS